MTITRIQYTTIVVAAGLLTCVAFQPVSADDEAGVVRITDQSRNSREVTVIRANDDEIGIDPSLQPTIESVPEPTPTGSGEVSATADSADVDCVDSDHAQGNGQVGTWWENQVSMYYARRERNIEGVRYARYQRQCRWANQNAAYRARNEELNCQFRDHFRCKFGYFIPTGCCGKGCPIAGRYGMVYAVEPNYFDPRDGQIFAAQGTGVPMAVPLAPNVGYTYNYSWGIPSSRLTPLSNVS
ncbi:MAG: hypothetical protein ACKVT0_13455, partial [Planctomycetaceae bacterium]